MMHSNRHDENTGDIVLKGGEVCIYLVFMKGGGVITVAGLTHQLLVAGFGDVFVGYWL